MSEEGGRLAGERRSRPRAIAPMRSCRLRPSRRSTAWTKGSPRISCTLGSPTINDTVSVKGFSLRRSEERRVGKECVRTCRFRCSRYHYKNKKNHTTIEKIKQISTKYKTQL